jgi:hypothetical protein
MSPLGLIFASAAPRGSVVVHTGWTRLPLTRVTLESFCSSKTSTASRSPLPSGEPMITWWPTT